MARRGSDQRTGMRAYIRHAFLYHWNLLLFLGGMGLAVASPWPDALVPIIGGLELAYLTSLVGMKRFRTAIDAKLAKEDRGEDRKTEATTQISLQKLLEHLPTASLKRFAQLRNRSLEMRAIASGVRGQTDASDTSDSIRTPALDRLLFLFLRLLVTQAGLDRFLKSTSEAELTKRMEDVTQRLAAARTGGDERMIRSLMDSLADAELRIDNYKKAVKDAEFVGIELDRIETKIQALAEMGVSRQDPDYISHQVTAAAESMQHTEDAVNKLQHLTGLADELAEPPAILEADLGPIAVRER